jgi:hypothetical protein
VIIRRFASEADAGGETFTGESVMLTRRGVCGFVLVTLLSVACGTSPVDGTTDLPPVPPGGDVASPFPLDRGDDGPSTPGTYKGLPLRLVSRPAPVVSPVDGAIGVVCLGMSNGAQECGRWMEQVAGAWRAEVRSEVRIVNCAVGGHAIERWNDPSFDGLLWDDCIQRRLTNAGLRLDQVRVIYHKAANQFGAPNGGQLPPYPASNANYYLFLSNLEAFAARVREKFTNVQAVYTTARSYGGSAPAGSPRGEPQAYEEGHALNTWLTNTSTVAGASYGWGPYIWAPDCATGVTNASNVCYIRSDYRDDGVHPTLAGELKIARMIHERFRRETWYRP